MVFVCTSLPGLINCLILMDFEKYKLITHGPLLMLIFRVTSKALRRYIVLIVKIINVIIDKNRLSYHQ